MFTILLDIGEQRTPNRNTTSDKSLRRWSGTTRKSDSGEAWKVLVLKGARKKNVALRTGFWDANN
jgi:hypothetical protein